MDYPPSLKLTTQQKQDLEKNGQPYKDEWINHFVLNK